jgi:hypothetical protein
VAFEDHGLRAEPARFRQRHAGVEAEAACLVGARGDAAGPHDDRLALEARLAQLLDRGEEGVDVDVKDGSRGHN